MAPSRRLGSNSSPTRRRSLPSSPRNASRVRGRRPSPSAKLARSCCSSASAARAFVSSRRSLRRANSVRTTSVVRLTPALQMVSRPMRSARSTSPARSLGARSATKAASCGSWSSRCSTTMRSARMVTLLSMGGVSVPLVTRCVSRAGAGAHPMSPPTDQLAPRGRAGTARGPNDRREGIRRSEGSSAEHPSSSAGREGAGHGTGPPRRGGPVVAVGERLTWEVAAPGSSPWLRRCRSRPPRRPRRHRFPG